MILFLTNSLLGSEGTTRRRDKNRICCDERCPQNILFLSLLPVVPQT